MTNIERKALELVNEVSDGFHDVTSVYDIHTAKALRSALCRAIEQHEAFRQEVSDAVMFDVTKQIDFRIDPQFRTSIVRFIITKPDPLVEAVKDILHDDSMDNAEEFSEAIREALAKRGLEIREKSDG